MKNIAIGCISFFDVKRALGDPCEYTSDIGIIQAWQTNEAFVKYTMKRIGTQTPLDEYITVCTPETTAESPTYKYLEGQIKKYCNENGYAPPAMKEVRLEDSERFDIALNQISERIADLSKENEVRIILDTSGGKRNAALLIQLLTKLLSVYGHNVEAYYTDADFQHKVFRITDCSNTFEQLEILDAVEDFVTHGTAAKLGSYFKDSPTIKALTGIMVEFSNAVQLCSTDLDLKYTALINAINKIETDVTPDNNKYMIRALVPMMREKFHISQDSTSISKLGIVHWCIENRLIQQALTIYNEYASSMLFGEGLITAKSGAISSSEITKHNKRFHSDDNSAKLSLTLGMVFDNMFNSSDLASDKTVHRYSSLLKDKNNIRAYADWDFHVASFKFEEKYLPAGITLNIPEKDFRRLLTDLRFAKCTRNTINHASDEATYDNQFIQLLKQGHYKSYTSPISPDNIADDLLKALNHLETTIKSLKENC